jgi:beta-mannosidase
LRHQDTISLEGNDWRLGYKKTYDGSASGTISEGDKMTEWINAVVPGNVRGDLMTAGRLPDLYRAMNSNRSDWVNDCVWWYRKKFRRPKKKHKRHFLELQGVDYLSQVYFNGRKLGENEGMFTRHLYDVSSIIKDENVLNVRIIGPSFFRKPSLSRVQQLWEKIGAPLQNGMEVFPERASTLKCQMSFGWDFAPDMRTIGIWDEVNLIGCGSVFIGRVDVRSSVYRELDSAKLQIKLYLNSTVAGPLKIGVQMSPANFDGPPQSFNFNAFVKKGTEVIERNIVLKNPQLWHPWDMGEPNLYKLDITLYDGDRQTDAMSGLIGLREIEMERNPGSPKGTLDWTFVVNGEREYIRGANWVPADALMGRVRDEDYEELIKMAKEAHINMFRVWGGGLREKRAFYDICSREGILVWQEFPFACVFLGHIPRDEAFLRIAEKEVASIIKSIANQPCVAVYCGGNEFSPTRNAKVISKIARVVRSIDSGRTFLSASPAKGDSHNWSIWHGFENIRKYREDSSQFASEFGLQAAPSVESLKKFITNRGLWPRGEEWEHHKAELEKLDRYAGPAKDSPELGRYVEATQRAQAFALQTAIEHYRRRKYKCSGTMFWQFNEPWPAISWSVVDYYRDPKLAYHKLKEIYNPLLVSLKYELRRYEAGEVVPIEGWVVNDFQRAFSDCVVDVHMDDEGERIMNLGFDVGTIPPDSAQMCFQFGLKLPDRPVRLLKTIIRSGDMVLGENSYDLDMVDEGESTLWHRIYDQAGKWVMT